MWQNELVLILRHLVDDICKVTYSDARLEEVLLVSARLLLGESQFEQGYTVNVSSGSLSPDPVALGDDMFISLLVLKSACLLARGALRDAAAKEGIRVTDKFGSIEIKGKALAAQDLVKSYCDAYQQAKIEYAINNVSAVRAIFNVVVGPNINVPWTKPSSPYPHEEFFS